MGAAQSRWQTSALVDTLAYASSWAPCLALLVLFGDRYRHRAAIFIAVNLVSEVHRVYTFPYALVDPRHRRADPRRFVWLPISALAFVVTSVALLRFDPSGAFDHVLEALTILVGAWNIYHVLAQKYGLLRVYAAKRDGAAASPTADRGLLYAWLVLVPAWLLPREAEAVGRVYAATSLAPYVKRGIALLGIASTPLLVLAALVITLATARFLVEEFRANRLRSAPRLSLAVGTILLCTSFLLVRPLYAYLAFAFSHAVEYMVFVWAFQRRCYADDRVSPLGRVLSRPLFAYGLFTATLAVMFFVFGPWSRLLFPQLRWQLAGLDVGDGFIRPYIVASSALHFYYDGLLWKLGRAEVRAHV